MNKKFSEKSFIFYGINFIVGFGFIATIQSVIKTGNYSLLIFAITSLIAAGIMLAFARGTQYFGNKIGGSYVYAKEAFPKSKWFWFLNGWNQFMQAPLFSATTPLFFSTLVGLFVNNQDYKILLQLGSLLFFIALTIVSAFSLNVSKKVVLWSAIVKWIVFILILGVIVYLVASSPEIHLFKKENSTLETITPFTIISSILSFIYAYGGIEGLAGLSTSVKTKNFQKILLYLFGFVIFIYLIFFLLFSFIPTINSSGQDDYVALIMRNTLGLTGIILFTVGLLFKQITSTIFSMVYYAKAVVPLALDGFLPSSLAKVAKNDQHKNAIKFVTAISIFAMILLTIIPQALGISNSFGAVLNAGNLVFFVLYLIAILSILVISFKRKEFKIPNWEKLFYILTIILIGIVILVTLLPPILNEKYDPSQLIVILSYIGFMVLGFVIWALYKIIKSFNPLNRYAKNYSKIFESKKTTLEELEKNGIKEIVEKLFINSFKTQNKFILLTKQSESFRDLIIRTLAQVINFNNKENELPTKNVYKLNTEKLLFTKESKITKILYKLFYNKANLNSDLIIFIENIDLFENNKIIPLLHRVKNQTNIKIIASLSDETKLKDYNDLFIDSSIDDLSTEQKIMITLYAKNKILAKQELINDNDVDQLIKNYIEQNMYISDVLNKIDTAAAYLNSQNSQWEKNLKELYEQKIKLEYEKYAILKDKKNSNVKEVDSKIDQIETLILEKTELFDSEKQKIRDLISNYNLISEHKAKVKEYEKDNNIPAAYNLINIIIPEIEQKITNLLNDVENFKEYKAKITKDIFLKESSII
ncbi:APC family permease [Mycoplasma sp. CSL10166]|uniref:APC family permease n=1 Tax=Mycoplasma sp. CSL10166 TaxID=2813825 RepID=UPI00197B1E2A|nr:APC family permease [Mycoplasma sp. CSL10166]MBN4084141.1 amino acid permease [Mycoplasma sp. CSL10166]